MVTQRRRGGREGRREVQTSRLEPVQWRSVPIDWGSAPGRSRQEGSARCRIPASAPSAFALAGLAGHVDEHSQGLIHRLGVVKDCCDIRLEKDYVGSLLVAKYLPRTPPRMSYSALISSLLACLFAGLINPLLHWGRNQKPSIWRKWTWPPWSPATTKCPSGETATLRNAWSATKHARTVPLARSHTLRV